MEPSLSHEIVDSSFSLNITLTKARISFYLKSLTEPSQYEGSFIEECFPIELKKSFAKSDTLFQFLKKKENFIIDLQRGRIELKNGIQENKKETTLFIQLKKITVNKIDQQKQIKELRSEINILKQKIKPLFPYQIDTNNSNAKSKFQETQGLPFIIEQIKNLIEKKHKIYKEMFQKLEEKFNQNLKELKQKILFLYQPPQQQEKVEKEENKLENSERQIFFEQFKKWKCEFEEKRKIIEKKQKIKCVNGEYQGEIEGGKRNGFGIYFYSNGDKFEGEFKDGKRNGKGIYTWKKGYWEEAQYIEDRRHGRVIRFLTGDKIQEQFYDNGVKIG